MTLCVLRTHIESRFCNPHVVLLVNYTSSSSGDMDGDQFGCIWDQRLVPPKSRECMAFNYQKFAKDSEMKYLETNEEKIEHTHNSFVINAMCNSSLGKVANLHLALCDQLPEGARDELAIEVAKQQSLAVDYPKTGINRIQYNKRMYWKFL
jgi:hypothetical protein